MAIHGRTRAAAYTGQADWEYIREVKASAPLPILGNGDLVTPELAVKRLQASGCDGVMIGRGCLKNPRIFLESRALKSGKPLGQTWTLSELLNRLCVHLESFYDVRMTLLQMRKFAAWYSAGYPGAAQFRKDLFQLSEREAVLARIDEFYLGVSSDSPADTSDESFLMGGHG